MYPKGKFFRSGSMVDSLTCYREREKVVHDVKNGIISSAEGGFLNGYHEASIYSEEEEEE